MLCSLGQARVQGAWRGRDVRRDGAGGQFAEPSMRFFDKGLGRCLCKELGAEQAGCILPHLAEGQLDSNPFL